MENNDPSTTSLMKAVLDSELSYNEASKQFGEQITSFGHAVKNGDLIKADSIRERIHLQLDKMLDAKASLACYLLERIKRHPENK